MFNDVTKQAIYGLLNQSHNISVSLPLIHAIGNNEALLFQVLISKQSYYTERGMLDESGYFYATALDIEVSTGLTQRQQASVIKRLEEFELISTVRKGMPAKKYFKLTGNMQRIARIIEDGIEKLNTLKSERRATVDMSANKCENTDITTVSKKCENKNEQNVETSCYEMSKQESTNCQNMFQQNVDEKHIYKSYIENHHNKSFNQSIVDTEADRLEIDRLRERIADNINLFYNVPGLEYEDIFENGVFKPADSEEYHDFQRMYYEVFNIICDVVTTKSNNSYVICGQEYPKTAVKSVFLKLTEEHIHDVIRALMNMEKPVKNMRKYLISALYNSYFTATAKEMLGIDSILRTK